MNSFRDLFASHPTTKIYYAPLSNLQESSTTTDNMSQTPLVTSSKPIALALPNLCTESITLPQAIMEHDLCDIDRLPKLLVRHSKNLHEENSE